MFFGDTSGASLGLAPPVPPIELPLPIMDKLVLHPGESASSYQFLCTLANKLMHATNFMPDFMNKCYAGLDVTEEDLTQFGQASLDPLQSSIDAFDGNSPWHSPEGRGYGEDSFGFSHPIAYYGRFWGEGLGVAGSKNLDWNPGAYQDYYFLSEGHDVDFDNVDDPELYAEVTGIGADNLGDYSTYIDDLKNYMETSYGKKSFYEIVMSGINDTNISYVSYDGDTGIDLSNISWGNFAYDNKANWDGEDDYGAFLFMVSITRARRMIYSAMSELWGQASMIRNVDNLEDGQGPMNEAMISQFEDVIQHSMGGAHANNKAFLYVFFAMQHYLHAIMPAYSGSAGSSCSGWSGVSSADQLGDGGFCGWMRSGQDAVAFKKFREWIRTNAGDYINDLSGDAKTNAQKIFNEFKYEFTQPYGGDGGEYVGWDYYYPSELNDGQDPYFNPMSDQHSNYTLGQLCRLGGSQLVGRQTVNLWDQDVNLYAKNWSVHSVGRFKMFQQQANSEPPVIMMINFCMDNNHRMQKKEYEQKVKEKKETNKEQKIEQARAESRHAAKMRGLKKAALRRKVGVDKSVKHKLSKTMRVSKSNQQNFNQRRQANQMSNQARAAQQRRKNQA